MITNERCRFRSCVSSFCSCSYGLWFNLGKSVQAASTGAFLPKSRTKHLTYFASLAPVSSEPGLSALFHLQPVWAVWLWSLSSLSEGGGATEWALLDRSHTSGTPQHTRLPSFPHRKPETLGTAAPPVFVLGSLWCNPPDNIPHNLRFRNPPMCSLYIFQQTFMFM